MFVTFPVMFGPNITGKFGCADGGSVTWVGPLKVVSDAGGRTGWGGDGGSNIDINASWADDTYGKASTVQPPSLRVLPCIKF